VHIDGAFGLWAAASAKYRPLTRGMEKADSWSLDAHKTLNTPYDNGIVLCKHPEALSAAMQATGSYIIYGENRDGMLYTPEMSRRSRAIELWATLKTIGKSGVEELVDGLCERAQQCAQELDAQGFHILNEVVFNQVLVAADTPEQTAAVLKNVQQSGECWCGGARWRDTPVIRLSICSWATTTEDIHRTVRAFVKARESLF
jgi:glutamate/tyrosine decarboxylase-like PLP-dependent enzyme